MSESTPASLFHICTPKQTLSSYFVLEIPYFDLIFTLIFEAIFLYFAVRFTIEMRLIHILCLLFFFSLVFQAIYLVLSYLFIHYTHSN